MDAPSLHLVVFPWLAFGHLIPFLELSKSLAKRGHKISFLSTPRNLQKLPSIPSNLSNLIQLIPFTLPPCENLPAGAEATTDVSPAQQNDIKKAFDGLEPAVAAFLSSIKPSPDWIIIDFASHWLPTIASSLGLPCIYFTVFPALAHSFFGPLAYLQSPKTPEELTVPPAWMSSSSAPAFRLYEARTNAGLYNNDSSGVTDGYRIAKTVEGMRAIAVRSCMEFEAEWLTLLQQVYEKPVVAVGLLPPAVDERSFHGDAKSSEIFQWLDKQAPASVLYVALGSEAALSIELLHQLALGLELSNSQFIWALRIPAGGELLPEGFESRIEGRGLVVMGWVPQVQVLAHSSVGGFLTHCGWSSIIEGLGLGLPLVLLPIFVDQGLNARIMAAKKVGVEVERREEDGAFSREAVAKAVRMVMAGERLRANAAQMKAVFGDKECNERYFDGFVNFLRENK